MRGLRNRPGALASAAWPRCSAGFFAVLVLRPWRGDLDVPYFVRGRRHPATTAYVKAVLDHGWYWHNPNLGAPEGQQLFDYPGAERRHAERAADEAARRFRAPTRRLSRQPLLPADLLHSSGCPPTSFLRRLTVSWPGRDRLFDSLRARALPLRPRRGPPVPVGVLRGAARGLSRPDGPRRRAALRAARRWTPAARVRVRPVARDARPVRRDRTGVGVVLLLGVHGRARGRRPRSCAQSPAEAGGLWREGGAVVAAILVLTLASLAPTLAYWARHGTNQQVAHRKSLESELYGLKLAQLVLPDRNHRIGKLASVRQRLRHAGLRGRRQRGARRSVSLRRVGLLWLLAISVLQLASPGRRDCSCSGRAGRDRGSRRALLRVDRRAARRCSRAVYPQIRAWNRLSIFIGFFALLGVGVAARPAAGRAQVAVASLGRPRSPSSWRSGSSTRRAPHTIPPYRAVAAEWRNDEAFVRAIDARLPEGALVFQLPYVPFPETPPVNRMFDYDELRGYLHSDDLRWSYGAVKGRDDPNAALAAEPVPALVRMPPRRASRASPPIAWLAARRLREQRDADDQEEDELEGRDATRDERRGAPVELTGGWGRDLHGPNVIRLRPRRSSPTGSSTPRSRGGRPRGCAPAASRARPPRG